MQQGSGPLVYYVFDVLEVDGEPLIDLPLVERRERLERLLDPSGGVVRFSDAFEDGEALLTRQSRAGPRRDPGQEAPSRATSRASVRVSG